MKLIKTKHRIISSNIAVAYDVQETNA